MLYVILRIVSDLVTYELTVLEIGFCEQGCWQSEPTHGYIPHSMYEGFLGVLWEADSLIRTCGIRPFPKRVVIDPQEL